ncbi:MAG: lytic transglycosylase domain-containing protein [Alphaproteobacteria bacterium GM7ARS4]|nr:lytic transglycosylase domain-containing protein [Alphaproteobacteria bacterium GM7ARS4]
MRSLSTYVPLPPPLAYGLLALTIFAFTAFHPITNPYQSQEKRETSSTKKEKNVLETTINKEKKESPQGKTLLDKTRQRRQLIIVPRPIPRPRMRTSPLKAHIQKPEHIAGIHYQDVVDLIEAARDEEFRKAYDLASTINHPLLKSYVRWKNYRRYWLEHSLDSVEQFMETHRGWPDMDRIRLAAENALSLQEMDAHDVITWFGRYPPQSNLGHLKRLSALRRAGQKEAEAFSARKIWREQDLMPQHKEHFLKKYAHLLKEEDYGARLQRLLQDGNSMDVKNKISQMRPQRREQLYTQWRDTLVPYIMATLIQALPEKILRKHPISPALKELSVARSFAESFQAIEKLPHDINNDKAWWQEYEDYIRFLLYDGYIEDAYRLAKKHSTVWKEGFSEGEWISGWIALSFLNDSLSAYRHFSRLYENAVSSLEKARAAYWAWRASQVLGRNDAGRAWLEQGARYPTTFYGQLCRAQISRGHEPIFVHVPFTFPFDQEALDDEIKPLNHDGLLTLLGIFAATDTVDESYPFLKHLLLQRASTDVQRAYIIELLARFGHGEVAASMSRQLMLRGYSEPEFSYPVLEDKHIPVRGIEKALLFSVIRQESHFMAVEAVSHAGALGWMQVMPTTAEYMSKDLNIPYSQQRLLHDHMYNMKIGGSYLKKLVKGYDGSYPLALAGYNAGPSRVRVWMRKFGDPRRDNVDKIDWIEALPFYETRHYVLKVLSNLQVYRKKVRDTATISE